MTESNNPRIGKVAVLMGGRSAEREISLQSGNAIVEALARLGYEHVAIDVGDDLCGRLLSERPERAVVALHGRFGEDGCVQGLLELLRIPYSGSGVRASALAMDKLSSKRLFNCAQLPTPGWCFPATSKVAQLLGLPLVLKPRGEGSSVGLSIAHTAEELEKVMEAAAGAPLMAEAYIAGRELTVAVLGAGDKARAIGVLEITTLSGVYDYEAKYERDDTVYQTPASLAPQRAEYLSELALKAHHTLECAGATRVDFRWDVPLAEQDDGERLLGEPQLLEVNTIPGMTSHSLLPKIAAAAGMGYDALVDWIVRHAGLKG
jgi:D-alanine-D-alanine ligase